MTVERTAAMTFGRTEQQNRRTEAVSDWRAFAVNSCAHMCVQHCCTDFARGVDKGDPTMARRVTGCSFFLKYQVCIGKAACICRGSELKDLVARVPERSWQQQASMTLQVVPTLIDISIYQH